MSSASESRSSRTSTLSGIATDAILVRLRKCPDADLSLRDASLRCSRKYRASAIRTRTEAKSDGARLLCSAFRGYEPPPERIPDQFGLVAQAKLPHEVRPMALDGTAGEQPRGSRSLRRLEEALLVPVA